MTTMDVVTIENKKAGSVDLHPSVFEAEVRPHLFQAEVRRQLARRRAGTHSTRNRAAVSGGGAKPYRQKGTGRARQGTTRAPQFAGGGVVFGPVPRSHEQRLNKKTRKAALCGALTAKRGASEITVIDDFGLDEYKTSKMIGILRGLGLEGKSVLIVVEGPSSCVEGSARNIPAVSVIQSKGLNVYDVLRHQVLVFTRPALEAVDARLGAGAEAGQ